MIVKWRCVCAALVNLAYSKALHAAIGGGGDGSAPNTATKVETGGLVDRLLAKCCVLGGE